MSQNLAWLQEKKYSDQKIIVWAHNYHISKFAGHYAETFLNEAKPMGAVFTENAERMKDTYILGFSSYEGRSGRIGMKPYKMPKPKPQSLENWVHSKNMDYAFIDFKPFNLMYPDLIEPFFMSGAIKGKMYHESHLAQWNRIFDGVFYIREIYPCKK